MMMLNDNAGLATFLPKVI